MEINYRKYSKDKIYLEYHLHLLILSNLENIVQQVFKMVKFKFFVLITEKNYMLGKYALMLQLHPVNGAINCNLLNKAKIKLKRYYVNNLKLKNT